MGWNQDPPWTNLQIERQEMELNGAHLRPSTRWHRFIRRPGVAWKRHRRSWRTRRWMEAISLITMVYLWWKVWYLQQNQGTASFSLSPTSESTQNRSEAEEEEKIAFVFTVHGAISYFKGAVETLVLHTTPKPGQTFKLFVADDCAHREESKDLRQTLEIVNWDVKVISMGKKRAGYTKAVNAGLKAAWGEGFEIMVMINSDVVFTPHWLEPLVAALQSSSDIGMAGPISNAASYQSVPELTTNRGTWNTNPLPEGWNISDMSKLAFLTSKCNLIDVPILNGFLIAIHRRALQEVGWMNEELFPHGYGEENEYAFRVKAAGLKLVVSPMSYVYHHKTKSFSDEERKVLAETAKQVMKKYMGEKLANAEWTLRGCEALASQREELAEHLESMHPQIQKRFSVLFILNPMPRSLRFMMRGGWISVVQEAVGLIYAGVHARVAVQDWTVPRFEDNFPEASKHGVFLGYQSMHADRIAEELLQQRLAFDFLVATHHTTVPVVVQMGLMYPNSIRGYYVQDIEENFHYNRGTNAASTFRILNDGFIFAKTRFLVEQLWTNYNVSAHLIPPTLDRNIFTKSDSALQHVNRKDGIIHVCAMVRTLTPRRNPLGTLDILATVRAELGPEKIQASVFGSSRQEIQSLLRRKGKGIDLLEGINVLGAIGRQQVADLLGTCTFFLDFSDWQAFGRSGLEAMAMGCIPILPIHGGVNTYARNGINALLVNTTRVENGVAAIKALVTGKHNLLKMRVAALLSSHEYDIPESGQKTANIFHTFQSSWISRRHLQCSAAVSCC